MSYNPTTWHTGDIVSADKLNNIEQELITLDTASNKNSSDINQIKDNLGNLANLTTTAKTNLVSAINEAAQSGGTEVVIDNTLTQTGQAADAKKTGDEISAIKADLEDNVNGLKNAFADIEKATLSIITHRKKINITSGQSISSTSHIFDITIPAGSQYRFRINGNDGAVTKYVIYANGNQILNNCVLNTDYNITTNVEITWLSIYTNTVVQTGTLEVFLETTNTFDNIEKELNDVKSNLESMTSTSRNILTEEWEHGIYSGSGAYSKANNSNTSNTTVPPVIDVEPNTKYTISWGMTDNTAGTIYVFQYASDGTYIKSLSLSFANGKYTFTTDSTAKRVGIQRYTSGASAWTDLVPPWTQMEVGDTATPYISSRVINPEMVTTDATFSDTVLPANSKAVGDFINDIFAQSRNLFNLKWNRATYNSSGEYIEQSASSSSNGATLKLEVEGGKRYTLSWGDAEVETGNVYFLQFGQNGEHLSTTSAKFATHEISIGVDATTKYVAFNRYGTGASSWTQLIPEWTQLEIGERTPYISPKAFAGKYIDYTLFLQRVVDAVESTINISSVDRSNITVPTIAHRGETLFAPQCTAPAYIAAKKYGHKIAENDVYISSDGYFVMWHDTTLNRLGNLQDINGYLIYTDGTDFYYVNGTSVYTWNGTQYVLSDVPIGNLTRCAGSNYSVTALTLAQLKRIDFGVYMGTQFSGTQILTFDEWVLICKQVGLYLYIDFKIAATSEQLSQLAGIVKRYGMSQYASWILNGTQINAVRAVIPNARILVMATPDTSNIQTLTPYLANGKIAYDLNGNIGETINSEAITLALNSGFEVGMWLVGYSTSDADKNAVFTRIRELLSYGVTELTLDHYKVEDAFLEWFND